MEEEHQELRVDRAACRKAEKNTLLAEEEKALRANPKTTRGHDHHSSSLEPVTLNATGIDNALDALSLTSANQSEKIDRHLERRCKAGFEDRRLPEVEEEHKGLRENQRIKLMGKEFEKHPYNLFNQAYARFDSMKDEIADIKEKERTKVEQRSSEK